MLFRSRQANENDEADLGQDVDRQTTRKQAGDGRKQAHRDDEDDRQRQLPTFVLRDQHQEDGQSGRTEDEEGRRPALLLLVGKLGSFEGDALWKNLAGKFLHAV